MTSTFSQDRLSHPKYAKLARQLSLKVEKLPNGKLLPSIRHMMQEFDASQATVYAALELLKRRGAIEHEPGVGMRVATPAATKRQGPARILLRLAHRSSTFHQQLLEQVFSLAESFDIRFMVEALESSHQSHQSADATLVIPGPTELNPMMLADWADNKPMVVLDRDLRAVGIDSVCSDNYQGGILAARHLLELGHRRIAVLSHRPGSTNPTDRINGFVQEIQNAACGAKVEFMQADHPLNSDECYPFVREQWSNFSQATALFTTTRTTALASLRAFQELGIRVPDQVSLVGYDDLGANIYTNPPLTTVDQQLGKMARAACQILSHRLALPTKDTADHSIQCSQIVPVCLNVRQSTTQPRG